MVNPNNESITERIHAAAAAENLSFENFIGKAVKKAVETTESRKSRREHPHRDFLQDEPFTSSTLNTAVEEIHCNGCGGRVREGSKYLTVSGWKWPFNFSNFPKDRKYNLGEICVEAGVSGIIHWSYPPKNTHFCELRMDATNLQKWESARQQLVTPWLKTLALLKNAEKANQMVSDYLRNPQKNQV